jgi:hypothetical protein
MARTCSRFAAFSTGSTVIGTFDPRCTHARPRASKACSTLRTVCGAQRKVFAIAEGRWRSALASKIWQRRTVKAS